MRHNNVARTRASETKKNAFKQQIRKLFFHQVAHHFALEQSVRNITGRQREASKSVSRFQKGAFDLQAMAIFIACNNKRL